MTSLNFHQKLQRYADLTVKIGLNLQPGQRLFILAYQLEVAPFVRLITRTAYEMGCPLVTVLWNDDGIAKIRQQHAPAGSFEEFPAWMFEGPCKSMEAGTAYLQVDGRDPKLMEGLDPQNLALSRKTMVKHYKPIGHLQGIHAMQWTVVAAVTQAWATRVFPDVSVSEAELQLWDAVFQACRVKESDPIEFWQGYIAQLNKRRIDLTARQYEALHFKGPGTDLMVGLPPGHQWAGGGNNTQQGVPFMPNLPTEEVFSMPHKFKVDGTVQATKPLNFQGNLIDGFSLTFEAGKVVDFSAEQGETLLAHLLDTDENARYLGEIALVPHQSPISQSGMVYMNTLYDENAANHLALGSAYRTSLENGGAMTDDEFEQAGGNDSLIHVDFMFGGPEMDVDGLLPNGTREPVMRGGEWVEQLG